MKYLTIIPARQGSKILPKKNILKIIERPLCEWSMIAACQLKIDQTIVVSTDCPEVQKIARSNKIECDSLRPRFLSQDHSSSADMVRYEIEKAHKKNITIDSIILLQPTSPLRTSIHVEEAISLFENSNCDAVQSYSRTECPPQWMFKISEDLNIDNLPLNFINGQEAGAYFRTNGAIYIIKKRKFLELNSFTPPNSKAYIMKRQDSIDIDEQIDFAFAQYLMDRKGHDRL